MEQISIGVVLILVASSLALLLSQTWRWSLVALAVQYVAAFWLINLVTPLGLAAVKLVVGLMVAAVLGAGQSSAELVDPFFQDSSSRLLRVVSAFIVWVLIYAIAPDVAVWIPTGMVIIWGGLVLIGSGLVQMSMSMHPLRVVLGLLTALCGFEVLYSSLETSVLVTGLLAVINVGLGLVGAYIMVAPEEEGA